jgi:hypothetical protein
MLVVCMIASLAQQLCAIVCIVELLRLHHIKSLSDVTMATKACDLL